mgnify:CR=1 FL=1
MKIVVVKWINMVKKGSKTISLFLKKSNVELNLASFGIDHSIRIKIFRNKMLTEFTQTLKSRKLNLVEELEL